MRRRSARLGNTRRGIATIRETRPGLGGIVTVGEKEPIAIGRDTECGSVVRMGPHIYRAQFIEVERQGL